MITVTRAELKSVVKGLKKFYDPKSSLPVLATCLIKQINGGISLTATNLADTFTASIMCNGFETWQDICINVIWLDKLLDKLTCPTVSMEADATRLTLKIETGDMTVSTKGLDANEFPPAIAHDYLVATFDVEDIRSGLKKVMFAASTDDARPALEAVQMKFMGDICLLSAADGYEMARCPVPCSLSVAGAALVATKATHEYLVPANALDKWMSAADINKRTGTVTVSHATLGDGHYLEFVAGNTTAHLFLTEGKYPDLDQVIPRISSALVHVSAKDMLGKVKALLAIMESGCGSRVHMQYAENVLNIWHSHEDTIANSTIPATVSYPDDKIAFASQVAVNGIMLADILTALGDTNITIGTKNWDNAIIFRDDNPRTDHRCTTSELYVVMPMSLTD